MNEVLPTLLLPKSKRLISFFLTMSLEVKKWISGFGGLACSLMGLLFKLLLLLLLFIDWFGCLLSIESLLLTTTEFGSVGIFKLFSLSFFSFCLFELLLCLLELLLVLLGCSSLLIISLLFSCLLLLMVFCSLILWLKLLLL